MMIDVQKLTENIHPTLSENVQFHFLDTIEVNKALKSHHKCKQRPICNIHCIQNKNDSWVYV